MKRRKELRFTLVHGTFASEAPWVQDESEGGFRSRLLEELRRALGRRYDEYQVCFDARLEWGARSLLRFLKDNTMKARLDGATKLAQQLRSLPRGAGTDRHFLVTHSHGGNVAMYALRDAEARARVDGLVCLAVPFLDTRLARFRRDVLLLSAAVLALVAFGLGSWWVGAYAALYGLLTAWILFSGNLGDSEKSLLRIQKRLEKVKLPDELAAADGSATPVLVLTTPGDEVSWLMTFGHVVGHHFRLAWDVLNRFGMWILGGLIAFTAARGVAERLHLEIGRAQRVASWMDQHVATPLLIVASTVLIVIAVMRWCFAFDGARWIGSLDTRTGAAPPTAHRLEPVTGPGGGRSLRHTDIQRRAVKQIADWVAECLA